MKKKNKWVKSRWRSPFLKVKAWECLWACWISGRVFFIPFFPHLIIVYFFYMHLRPSVDSHRCFLLVCLIRSHLRASVVLGKTFLSKQAFMCQSRKSTGKLMMESFHLEYILPLWTLVRCHGFSLTCCNFGSARSLNKIIWRMPKQLAFM